MIYRYFTDIVLNTTFINYIGNWKISFTGEGKNGKNYGVDYPTTQNGTMIEKGISYLVFYDANKDMVKSKQNTRCNLRN